PLISIIVSCFQRLTPSGIAAQDKRQMQDISGRKVRFCDGVNDVSPNRQSLERVMRTLAIFFATLAMTGPAAAETVQLYAAGSLKAALTDVSKAYEASTGTRVVAKYGPSGLLKDEIAGGAKADVFASANMEHPLALHVEKKSGAVVRFAR